MSRVFVVIASVIAFTFQAQAEELKVDFRYRPPQWVTSISLPDDWQKTLVSETGAVLYDYPGPHAWFKTAIQAGVAGVELKTKSQRLHDPRTPIVITSSEASGITLKQEAFAIVDSPFNGSSKPKARLYRVGRENTKTEWAKPPTEIDYAFQHIAHGQLQPIRYAYDVEAGGSRTIALGLIEGQWNKPGKRVLDLEVEGAAAKTLDVVAVAGQNRPFVAMFDGIDKNGDGKISIEVKPSASASDKNTVLSAVWVFKKGVRPHGWAVASGKFNAASEAFVRCGEDPNQHTFAPRRDMVRLEYEGTDLQPVLRIYTTRTLQLNPKTGIVSFNGRPFLVSRPAAVSLQTLEKHSVLAFDPSVRSIDVMMVSSPEVVMSAFGEVDALAERDRAIEYWKNLELPWNRIKVPDSGIQSLLDSSVRNIFQAREIKQGKPEFRVGPTIYRDMWLVDGSFLLEVAVQLGVEKDARRAIERILDYQQPSGQIVVLQPDFYKETGITLWILQRHAKLTQDKSWLEKHWKNVSDGVKWIKSIRKETLRDPRAPYAGLIPPGHPDGGIEGPVAEYTNVYWTLHGLRAAIEAAHWLGKTAEASDWQREYDNFMDTFKRAAQRDMKTDKHGNRYLPILMNPGPNDLPQKGQWAFCQAIFPGKILDTNDPIATGTLAMLDSVNSQGLVLSTGWMTGGIWTYFASFYAHAHLWLGGAERISKAQNILYSFANHASPLLVWREEQRPVGQGVQKVGDMPHNWASAEFIRLVRHMIAIERGDRLVLFEGIPAEWLVPGKAIELNEIATEFGRLTLRAMLSSDGSTATIKIEPVGAAGLTGGPVVDFRIYKSLGFKTESGEELPDEMVGTWGQQLTVVLKK